MGLWWSIRLYRTNNKEWCPFHHRGLESKSRKSGDIWSNRHVWPWSQNEVGQRLTEFCQEGALVIQTPSSKRRLYTWTSPDGQYRNQIDYTIFSQRWRSSIQSIKTRSGTDCGSVHKLLTEKFRLKLKKVGKTNSPFRHDLNQITVEVMNRFKGLGLVGRVIEELRTGL